MKRIAAVILAIVIFLSGCAPRSIEDAESLAEALKIDEGYLAAPGEIYRTLGSENGLARVKMYADGTVGNFDDSEESYESCELSTISGKILIFCLPYVGNGWNELKEGDKVRLYFNYQGYSEKYSMPSGVFMRAKYEDGTSVGGASKDDDTMNDFMLDDVGDENTTQAPAPVAVIATPKPDPVPAPTTTPIVEENPEPTESAGQPAYVDAKSLNMRSGPSKSADIVSEIEGGTQVIVTGEEGDWYAVTANGESGYMLKEYVAIGSAPERESDEAVAAAAPPPKPAETEATPAPIKTAESEVAEYNSPKITLAEFNSLHEGMTYSQAVEIIGGAGELMSEAGGELGSEYHTKMYMWEGSGSMGANANAMFQGGKLISKAQFGLK